MYTMGTQFDITEEGTEALEELRQSDFESKSKAEKLEYRLLTILDMDGLKDYQGLLNEIPTYIQDSDVAYALKNMKKKGWITVE